MDDELVESAPQHTPEEVQTTFNLLREGATLYLDTSGKDRIKYRERDDVFLRFGPSREDNPNAYTTCTDEHVYQDIQKHGIRKVMKA